MLLINTCGDVLQHERIVTEISVPMCSNALLVPKFMDTDSQARELTEILP